MDTKELELFVHLAKSLHFGRTGDALHLSPSAVSRTVKRLEERVGQQLLERDNRSVRLTPAGREFLHYAEQSLAGWQAMVQRLQRESEHLQGEISLFCSVTAAYSVLSTVLERFRGRYPAIELKLHTGDQADALERVAAGEEDIGIAARPHQLSSRLSFHVLQHSPLRFIAPVVPCAVSERLAGAEAPAVTDWPQLPFILAERGMARTLVEGWFRRQRIHPNVYAQVSGHEAVVSMVALGLGVAVVPELVLVNSPLRERVRTLAVEPALEPFAIGVASLQQRLANPLVKAFWDCAKAAYAPTAF